MGKVRGFPGLGSMKTCVPEDKSNSPWRCCVGKRKAGGSPLIVLPRGRDALRSVENLHPGVTGAVCITVTISTSLGCAPGERESSPDSCSLRTPSSVSWASLWSPQSAEVQHHRKDLTAPSETLGRPLLGPPCPCVSSRPFGSPPSLSPPAQGLAQ